MPRWNAITLEGQAASFLPNPACGLIACNILSAHAHGQDAFFVIEEHPHFHLLSAGQQ